jgi:hypothetical protein
MKAYQLIKDNILVFASGGIEDLEETKQVKLFINKNNILYKLK